MRHDLPLALGVACNVLFAIMTLIGAYGGYIYPSEIPVASLLVMVFPGLIVADIVLLLLDLMFRRPLAWVPAGAMALSVGAILDTSPVSLPMGSPDYDEERRMFTLLTYNTLNFIDNQYIYPDSTNRTVSFILSTDADIVCLQECGYIGAFGPLCVTHEQTDSLMERYPYRHVGKNGQTMLSKFPFLPIPLRREQDDEAQFAAYRTNIHGHVTTIFNVHLQSLGLTTSDRELFLQMTSVDRKQSLAHIRSQLLDKLFAGFEQRARQADRIALWTQAFDDTNILLCGDFNDVPASYTYRLIRKAGLHDAYRETAFWPGVTHYADNFYFRIDHILYRGGLKAVNVHRGNVRSSDHYWLEATFLWDAPKDGNEIQQ